MNIFQSLFGATANIDLTNILTKNSFLVDVRTRPEFAEGTVKGAVNIPLDTVAASLFKFKGKENIIVFCRSGSRSAQAKTILQQNGFTNVINGGTWGNVSQYKK